MILQKEKTCQVSYITLLRNIFKQSYSSISKRIATRMDETDKILAPTIYTLRKRSYNEPFMECGLNIINIKKSTGSKTVTRQIQQPFTYLVRDAVYVILVQIDSMRKSSDLCNNG